MVAYGRTFFWYFLKCFLVFVICIFVFIMATASRMFLKDCSNTLIHAILTRTYYMSITISKNERVIDVYLKVSEFLAMS